MTNSDTPVIKLAEHRDQLSRVATYFHGSDCVEFVSEDTVSIHQRVDEFLTLILDSTRRNVIGVRLKGFRSIHNQLVEAGIIDRENGFVDLVPAIESVAQRLGNALLIAPERRRAYEAAKKVAQLANAA